MQASSCWVAILYASTLNAGILQSNRQLCISRHGTVFWSQYLHWQIWTVSSLFTCEQEPLERKLYPGMAPSGEPKVDLGADQYSRFEDMHFADQMAVDKLKVRRLLRVVV